MLGSHKHTTLALIGAFALVQGCSGSDEPPGTAAAQRNLDTFTISGTVYGDETPLGGVTVTALVDGTLTSAASTTTDSSGAYSLSVEAGTYDLDIDPAAGSGYVDDQIQNIVVAGDVRQDVILIAEASFAQISGTLSGYEGEPVANAYVQFFSGVRSFGTRTDDSGHYSLAVPAGTYKLRFRGGTPYSPNAPRDDYRCDKNGVSVTGDAVIDYTLPVSKLSGKVTGEDGEPVGGAKVRFWGGETRDFYCYTNHKVQTNADGEYTTFVLSSVNARVYPPSGSSYGRIRESVAVTGDTTRDFVLPIKVTATVSGTVTTHSGEPVSGAKVRIWKRHFLSIYKQTDANGAYSFDVPPGIYSIYVYDRSGDSPNVPSNYHCSKKKISVSDPVNVDLSVPAIGVTGRVLGAPGEVAIEGTAIRVTGSYSEPENSLSCRIDVTVTSDASGDYELLALAGNARVAAYPPQSSGYGAESHPVTWSEDTTYDITLAPGVTISGVITGHQGKPVAHTRVYIYGNGVNLNEFTDDNGRYSLVVAPDTYKFQVYDKWRWGPTSPHAPAREYYCRKSDKITISGNMQFDFALPVARVLGNATDFNGVPVPGTRVKLPHSYYSADDVTCRHWPKTSTSDASGRYSMITFRGTRQFTIRPPAGSGFLPVRISGVDVARDLRQDIRLQRPDVTPPVIVSGPSVIHLSDTSVSINWVTNEPSDSTVEYGLGGLSEVAHQDGMVTTHSVTLLGLDPTAVYSFQVSSTDAEGNGPTSSGVHTFSTLEPPGDFTPPLFTDGPRVVFVDPTNAIIGWETDEPATSVVHFGTTPALGTSQEGEPGIFVQSHSVTLSELEPETTYYARVESSDPDENGPTTSDIFTFTTAAAPDTAAPQIIAGPTVIGITDTSMTVTWKTDETATGGVSYTDGEEFNLVTDLALVSEHALTLTDLTPETTYSITVSSRDAVGNGPTLGGPIEATTLAQPDTTPPVITDIAIAAANTSAEIEWLTDELANSEVVYSAAGPFADNTASAVALVTAHSVFLQGLHPATTYHFAVKSMDASGNEAMSDWQTFTTSDCPRSGDPGGWNYCTEECPCYLGKGDCDSNAECSPGLTCVNNVGANYGWDSSVDVCEATCHPSAPGGWHYCAPGCPCEEGEGDCDSNEDCAPGLSCVDNVGANYGWDSSVDVCEATCHTSVAGGWDYCTPGCPCEEGEGDCDSSDECAPGLSCVENVGANYGWDSSVDVCEATCHTTVVGDWDYCSAGCPCGEGEGDCDSDAECTSGLICARDVGASYGWDQEKDVCEAPASSASYSVDAVHDVDPDSQAQSY